MLVSTKTPIKSDARVLEVNLSFQLVPINIHHWYLRIHRMIVTKRLRIWKKISSTFWCFFSFCTGLSSLYCLWFSITAMIVVFKQKRFFNWKRLQNACSALILGQLECSVFRKGILSCVNKVQHCLEEKRWFNNFKIIRSTFVQFVY